MPETAIGRIGRRLDYTLRQGSRVAWYAGHGLAVRRMAARMRRDDPAVGRPAPDRSAAAETSGKDRAAPATMATLFRDIGRLLARDLDNVERGLYPAPRDEDGTFADLLARSRRFLGDVPEVERRRQDGRGFEVAAEGSRSAKRPAYYLQNFHFQSGGWMTEESAELYDTQVEVLFAGSAGAMRRQVLVPLAEELAGRDQRALRAADVACGTGSFLDQLRRAFPRLPTLAIDLSEPYLEEARRRVGRRPGFQPVVAKAEALPIADDTLDIATSIYLFHELPRKIRRAAAAEFARVLRPGGLLVLMDSLQTGDEPDYDAMLAGFPRTFHEPYFEDYLHDDLEVLFAEAGFASEGSSNAFLSKVVSLRRV